jgi:hypothetical protein
MLAVAKEISLEDVRLGLEKMSDRLFEHPATVFVVTNLTYAEAPRLMSRDAQSAASLNWHEVRLVGASAHEYAEQIEDLGSTLARGWQTKLSPKTGNPIYVRPSVLVIYREAHRFLLGAVIPKPGQIVEGYDVILASQPRRPRMSAQFKAAKVPAPLARSLAPGGRLVAIQSCGADPALDANCFAFPASAALTCDGLEIPYQPHEGSLPILRQGGAECGSCAQALIVAFNVGIARDRDKSMCKMQAVADADIGCAEATPQEVIAILQM